MAYDAAGRLVRIDSSVDEVSQSNYDKQGQLKSAKNTFEADESYATTRMAIAAGDSTWCSRTIDSPPTPLIPTPTSKKGNRLSRVHKVSGDREDYTWDQRKRLIEVKFSNGATIVAKKIQYSYDVFDRLLSRTEDSATPFDFVGAPTELFVYVGDDVGLDFFDADGVGTGAGATLQKRYLHGPAVDQVLAQEDVTISTSHTDRVLWHLSDNLGSVRDLVRADGASLP